MQMTMLSVTENDDPYRFTGTLTSPLTRFCCMVVWPGRSDHKGSNVSWSIEYKIGLKIENRGRRKVVYQTEGL